MIKEINGNIFDSKCRGLVNPVNTHGSMGAGLALQFRKNYPNNYNQYVLECKKRIRGGQIIVGEDKGKTIFNFATKEYWRNPSRLEWIELGLNTLPIMCDEFNINDLAIPKLGCGLGKLNWDEVRKMIYEKLDHLNLNIELYV